MKRLVETRFSISCRWRKTGIKMRSGDQWTMVTLFLHVILRLDLVKFSFGECALSPEKRRLVSGSRQRGFNILSMRQDGSMEKELTDVGRERALRCTTSLSSIIVPLPASCLLSIRSSGPIPGLRGTLLHGASSASAGLHYGVRCWYTTMTQCVQRRRKLSTGVGVCSPRPA